MKKIIGMILTIMMLVLCTSACNKSVKVSIENGVEDGIEAMTLADLIGMSKDEIAEVRIISSDVDMEKVISDKDVIENFFELCNNEKLAKQDELATNDFGGIFIEVSGKDEQAAGFVYITDNGYADKYARYMSRIPEKAYAFESDQRAAELITKLLALAGK